LTAKSIIRKCRDRQTDRGPPEQCSSRRAPSTHKQQDKIVLLLLLLSQIFATFPLSSSFSFIKKYTTHRLHTTTPPSPHQEVL
jgi:hypothetical protein